MKQAKQPPVELVTVTPPVDTTIPVSVTLPEQPAVNFDAIEESPKFRELVSAKKRFLIPSVSLFLTLYILFPILISYTDVLQASFIGDISWTWIYALGLFVMTWTLVTIYMKKAASFDRMAEEVLEESGYAEGGQGR